MRASLSALTVLISLLVMAGHAVAQEEPPNLAWPLAPTTPEGGFLNEPALTPGPGIWWLFVTSRYAHRSAPRESAAPARAIASGHSSVDRSLGLDFAATLGVGRHFGFNLTLPTIPYQRGYDGREFGNRQALGDAVAQGKTHLTDPEKLGGFRLATILSVAAPTGNNDLLLSDGVFSVQTRLLAEMSLILIDVQTTIGMKWLPEARSYDGQLFQHAVPWAIGVRINPQLFGSESNQYSWHLEAHGVASVVPDVLAASASPIFAGVATRYTHGPWLLKGALELPLNDALGTPDFRAMLTLAWTRQVHDADDDGVPDDRDECSELAEDLDGDSDDDGCPDF